MSKSYEVVFYFTSGKTLSATYSMEKIEELCKTLARAWSTCCIASNEWGINFAQVTHYEVNEIR